MLRVLRRFVGIVGALLVLWCAVAPMALAQRINLATATTGGAYYPAGIAVAQLLSEKIPGLQVSASTSGGSVENITLLEFNEAQIAWVQSNVLEDAYLGTGTFAGQPHPQLRILLPGVENHYHMLVDREAGINTLREWRGKRVVVGRLGSGTVVTHEVVLGAFGISLNDIQADYLGQTEAIDAIRNGRAHATIAVGAAPLAAISEALAGPGTRVRVLSLSEEEIQQITASTRWITPMTIPAGVYPGQTEPIYTVGHVGFLVVTDRMSEELAYQIVKTIYENAQWLIETYPGWDNGSFKDPKTALTLSVPLHPGAERYLREASLLD